MSLVDAGAAGAPSPPTRCSRSETFPSASTPPRRLAEVSLTLLPGEVHGIAGENGAGKSTLIKIMTGIHPADTGSMTLAGESYSPHSSAEAQRRGVAAIYQEPSIFPDLSVAENIFIGHEDQGWLVDFGKMHDEAEVILTALDIAVDPRLPASGLTVAGQQAVEIAKAISLDVRVLIMDEPTASLSAHEVDRLFRQVRRLRDSGVSVVFITHRLEELFVIADRISVFRDGRRISTRAVSEVTQESLVREMVGRDPSEFFSRQHHAPGDVVLQVDSLGRTGVFSDVTFDVRRGEVLGFAGLVGAGRTDIGLALFGVAPADEGTILIDGRPVVIRSPRAALDAGIAYLSEDRRKLGLSMPQPVDANITLATLDRYTNRLGLLERAEERADAAALAERLGIRTPSMATPVHLLSGGNQQKTMLAKWLNASPRRADPRRAHPGYRRRRQGGRPPLRRRAGPVGDRRHPHLVGPARGPGDERPRGGAARGPAAGDLRPGRGHRGAGHDHRAGRAGRMSSVTEATVTSSAGSWLRPDRVKELTLLGLIAAAVIVFSLLVDDYLNGQSFVRITTTVVIVAILAVGQGLVIISRNIDLSVGSIVGVAAWLTGDFLGANQWAGPVVAILLAIVVGAVLGSVNGALVAYGGVPAIIVTLGTLAVFRTLLSFYSGGANITAGSLPGWVLEFYQVTVFSIGEFEVRLVFVIAVAVVLAMQWALSRVRWGRRLYAIGSNPDAAHQAGLPTSRLVFWSFVGSGALAGLAGFMYMTRAGTVSATAGGGLELESVAAAVVGGVSILGGSGTMVGVLLGAILLDTLRLGLLRVPGVSEFWRDAFLGVLILGAVILDAALHRRFTRRWSAEARRAAEDNEPRVAGMSTIAGGGEADA